MSDNGKFVLILDSTQLANYSACPTMWLLGDRYRLIRNDIASKIQDDKIKKRDSALDKGTFIHKLFERYYRTYRFIYDQTNAIEYALSVNIDAIQCECGHAIEQHAPQLPNLLDNPMACACTSPECMCDDYKAKLFPLSQQGRADVAQRFRESIYTWSAKGDFDVSSPDYVEVGFSELLYEDDEKIYILEGRMDIAQAAYQGATVVVDHKLQDRRKDLYMKRIQFRNYAMVSRQPFFVINYIRMAKEASTETFKRQMISFSAIEHLDWRARLISTYHDISKILMLPENERIHRIRQEFGNCETGNGYAACQFTPICEELYLGDRMMHNRIEQLYQIRPEWKPW